MKKVLFATTALVATAGVAAADVTFGGYGRFGLYYNDQAVNETSITSRFRLQIDATAESDMGVQFGARVRIQQDDNDLADEFTLIDWEDANDDQVIQADELFIAQRPGSAPNGEYAGRESTGINGVRFFARAGGFEVGVGNIFGALEFMPGQYPIDLGLTGLSYNYSAYNGGGDAYDSDDNGAAGQNGIEFIYSIGGFSIHGSASDAFDRRAVVGSYTLAGFTGALGVQDSNRANDTEWSASVAGDIGPAFLNLTYADNGTDGDHWVLAGRIDIGAATDMEAYWSDADNFTDNAYGIDFNHDMGGGTSVRGGIEYTGFGVTQADLGVRFDF